MNEQYLVKRTKCVASPFPQLQDVCFTETTLESLSKTLLTVGLMKIDLLVLVLRGVMVQPASYLKFVRNSSPTNRNIFFLVEITKSMPWILLMFVITICGICCYRKEMNVLEIIFGVSLSAVALLFYHSNPGHIALQEGPVISLCYK